MKHIKLTQILFASLFTLLFSQNLLAGGCGSGNKEDFYDELEDELNSGGRIVMGYQNCGGYTVDKVKFYIRVDGDTVWSTTKTGDLKINQYHIVDINPSSIGRDVRAELGPDDDRIQLRIKIWIRAGEKKSETKYIPYNKFAAWGTNSDGTTTKGNGVDTKLYRENGYHTHFMDL